MGHIQGANRYDVILFPERLDDDIAEGHPVRGLDACVDALDRAACGFHRAMPAAPGRPGYAPCELLQLSRYGSLYRLRASRRLEPEPHRKIDWRWRLNKLRPDHQTIADFRQPNLQPLRQVCRPCTRRCQQLDLVGAALIAIDGRTFRAVHAQEPTLPRRGARRSSRRLTRVLKPLSTRSSPVTRRMLKAP